MKNIKINDKKNVKILIFLIIILIIVMLFLIITPIIISFELSNDIETIAQVNETIFEVEWFENEESEFENIVNSNIDKTKREEIFTKTVELEYETEYINTNTLKKGKTKVIQKGKDGKQEIIIRKIYLGEELIADEQIGRRIVELATNEIVYTGTGKGSTSSTNSNIKNKIDFNIKLNKKSGLTLEQFKKILSNNKQDKNNVFESNAEYFYYIEQQYNINGVFVAALGIHESGWGTSKLAKNKKNLFGYGAYDRSAYSSAYKYTEYSASIDMIARVLVKHYLNSKGTKIYNGETATGKYYYGNTLKAVNTKYATDKNWSNAVYTWMNYLYNRL